MSIRTIYEIMKLNNINLIHATCVSVNNNGLLIMGKSSTGKSSLALDLVFSGGKLIADDITKIFLKNNLLCACAPEKLPAGLEVRNFGIIKVPILKETLINFVIDLSKTETERLPQNRTIEILNAQIPYYKCSKLKNLSKIIYFLTKFGKINVDQLYF